MQAMAKVEIIPVQGDGLADAHTGHREQRNQCLVSEDAKRKSQGLRRHHQRGNVVV